MCQLSGVIKLCDHVRMLRNVLNPRTGQNRVVRLLLVFALVFASAHVALHDEAASGEVSGHSECQTCRLNNVPMADLAVFSLPDPQPLLLYVFPIAASDYQLLPLFQSQRARAPPVLI